MTDKELNKEICKEMQAAAVSFLGSCKFELYKQKGYFLTGELAKVCDEKPWELGYTLDFDEEVTVVVGEFNCKFSIRYVFKLLSKFEKLSGTTETVFGLIEGLNDAGSCLSVVVGALPSDVERIRVTRYAKNGKDIVNRNMMLTKISDVTYVGNEDCSGRFDTYLKTDGGVYFVGVYSMEYAKAITISQASSAYASRIESFGDFSLIDIKIIGDVIPDRLNEAKELRDGWLRKKEEQEKEDAIISANTLAWLADEKRKDEVAKLAARREAKKAERLNKANNTKLENRLGKLVRYNGGVLTVKEYLHALKDTGHTPEVSEKSSVKYNRIKYNRMGYAEQQEYDRKLEKMVPMYVAINSDKVFVELNKLEFDYFSSMFEKCEAVDVVESRPVDGDDAEIDALCDPEVPSATDQTNEAVTAADRNVVCIECEPEDVPDYWDFLEYEAGTTKPDPVCLNATSVQEPERMLPDKEDSIPTVCATERLPTVFAVERLAGNYTHERLHVFSPVSRRFLVTNKGMYYLIA